MQTKKCSKCGEVKDFSSFSKGTCKGGIYSHCKKCDAKRAAELRESKGEKGRLKAKKYARDYYKKNKERVIDVNTKYYIKNKGYILSKSREYEVKRRKNDPIYKMYRNIRVLIGCCLRRYSWFVGQFCSFDVRRLKCCMPY